MDSFLGVTPIIQPGRVIKNVNLELISPGELSNDWNFMRQRQVGI
jgi:hypothetical protein